LINRIQKYLNHSKLFIESTFESKSKYQQIYLLYFEKVFIFYILKIQINIKKCMKKLLKNKIKSLKKNKKSLKNNKKQQKNNKKQQKNH
jgi:hypothetical protein